MPPTSLLYQYTSSSNVCTTAECIAASKIILSYVDLNVDPCSDFYQYTCGSWLNSPPVMEAKKKNKVNSVLSQVTTNNIDKIETILNGTYDDIRKNYKTSDVGFHTQDEESIDRSNFEFLKKFYNVCKDVDSKNSLGPTPIFEDIAKIENILFPINGTNINLATTLAQFTLSEVEPLFSIYYFLNLEDHSKFSVYLSKPMISIDNTTTIQDIAKEIKLYLGVPSKNDTYYNIIHEKSIADNKFELWSDEKIETAAENYFHFTNQLSQISQRFDDDSDEQFFTIQELQTIIPNIHWETYFNILTDTSYVTSETGVIGPKEYFQRLYNLLNTTSTAELQEYFIISYLKSKYYYLTLGSQVGFVSETCTALIGIIFRDIVGRYFVLQSFGDVNEEKKFLEMVLMLKESWLSRIPGIPWLDNETKVQATHKINLLKEQIVYSHFDPNWADPSSIQDFYKDAIIDYTNYFTAINSAIVWNYRLYWKQFTQNVPEEYWDPSGYVQQVNALYEPQTNTIQIPVGIIQSPLYNSNFPQYINFGGIGTVIGHELVHSLDTSGRLYNGTGYLESWWSEYSNAEFDKRAKCIIDDYNKLYLVDDKGEKHYVNGTLGSGEEIADAGGINIALLAYQQYVNNQLGGVPEPTLSGLEHLTPEQLFFISHGISFCEYLPPSKVSIYDYKTHQPGSFRINVPLQNSVEFAKIFNCPVGKSKMNPKQDKDKCAVW